MVLWVWVVGLLLGGVGWRILDLTPGAIADFAVTRQGDAYEELLRERARRQSGVGGAEGAPAPTVSAGKEQYLKNKQEQAEARKKERRLERMRAEAEKLEAELEALEAEMNGDAATDYVRLATLDTRKNEIEERLLELYEEI